MTDARTQVRIDEEPLTDVDTTRGHVSVHAGLLDARLLASRPGRTRTALQHIRLRELPKPG